MSKLSTKHAKAMRANPTEAEQRLWYRLRAHRLGGIKFKRQKPIGPYIVDFACVERRLVIEIDGGQHMEQTDYDRERDRFLASLGYRVLRFWNNQVLQETEEVLLVIVRALDLPPLSPTPLPANGRGAIMA